MITSLTANPRLGFIGIGSMGRLIARRLLESGYNLTAYNRDRTKAEALVGYGAIVAKSITDLASNTDVILSCLANDDAVRTIYAGPEGVFANVRPGSVVIEMSTVNPETSRELYKLGAARAVSVLDVPISGSTAAAEQGTLTLFAGGERKIFDGAEPIFRAVARQYFYLGNLCLLMWGFMNMGARAGRATDVAAALRLHKHSYSRDQSDDIDFGGFKDSGLLL